jgi:hypothetical protein
MWVLPVMRYVLTGAAVLSAWYGRAKVKANGACRQKPSQRDAGETRLSHGRPPQNRISGQISLHGLPDTCTVCRFEAGV